MVACILIVIGVLLRTHFHLGDNVEFVTSGALVSAYYLGLGWGIVVPLTTMFLSDLIIGNTTIFLFTWSAYIIIGIAGYILMRIQNSACLPARQEFRIQNNPFSKFRSGNLKFIIIKATGLGILASFWFYLWTNFGVWVLDSWGMYPKTIAGLIQAYAMGIPFLKFTLIGNMVFVPLSFCVMELATKAAIRIKKIDSKAQIKQFV